MQPSALSLTKPISILKKELTADFKAIFKAAAKAAIAKDWREVATAAADVAAAIGLQTQPEEMAWLLVRRSLLYAVCEIVNDCADIIARNPGVEPDGFAEILESKLAEAEYSISSEFFDNPAGFELLDVLSEPLKSWLNSHGFSAAEASSTAGRLPSYFVYALNEEWRRHPDEYCKVEKALNTPFASASERDRAWSLYQARLRREVDRRMFGEAFGLSNVYVAPRAYHLEKIEPGMGGPGNVQIEAHESVKRRVVVDLEVELEDWLKKAEREDAVRVVAGGPGIGKSSFAKMFAAKESAKRRHVLYVPLHLFDPAGDVEHSVGRFFKETQVFQDNPLDLRTGPRQLLLIFDGLDELAMQGKEAAEIAKNFLDEIRKFVEVRNYDQVRLQVLIFGRELVVQANGTQFRKARQIFHILPYFVTKEDRLRWAKEGCRDDDELLGRDDRDAWWRNYGIATGRPIEAMPNELKRRDLTEITAQPLLNYLVALSLARNRIDFRKEINLNEVYNDLLEAVFEREYADGRQHPSVGGMSFELFDRILQEIALAAWHGDGRTTTVKEIEVHCESSGLSELLAAFRGGRSSGTSRLLAAFYFRQHGHREGEQTFEFTHKSFGEYLTAKRLLEGLVGMEEELGRRKKKYDRGWDDRRALEEWARLCGPSAMDEDLFRFVRNEIRLAGEKKAARWQALVCQLVDFMLRHGMPMERLGSRLTYQEQVRQARNAEESLLAVLHACALVSGKTSRISWPERTSFGLMISRLQGQRHGPKNTLAFDCVCMLDLRDCALDMRDLYSAFLRSVNLTGASAYHAILSHADLSGANLSGGFFVLADFSGASLADANMVEFRGEQAVMRQTKLQGAKMRRAILTGADLRQADLTGADLTGANLVDVDFRGAKLAGAILAKADLRGAMFDGADLTGADSAGAVVEGSDVKGAKGSRASSGQGTLPL
ncbi:hypothetical protein D7X55_12655 [Corallococcus sp. AB049A]|uniref:pentapeptide repeat-containing protein n=1 Tax=Corallococcus sp. AB049A TaxID=2316721 RepID=UPI000EECBDE1|nr:pentapeptide repeat-containing protein [Corallococcus sp. AB049A]RKI68240.1 hypothetical protein D7X55_12655 [Corallococcus sp. AB049A]